MRIGKRVFLFFMSMLLITSTFPMLGKALAVAMVQRSPVIVGGDITNLDFNVTPPAGSVLDTKFLGQISGYTSGANSYGNTTDNGNNVFYIDSGTASVNMYKLLTTAITNRFGIEYKVKFNNTTSIRSLSEAKYSGASSWPNLMKTNSSAQFIDSKNNVIGTYAADTWYDVVFDVDVPNHRYSAWITGGSYNATLVVDNQDLGTSFANGFIQHKLIQNASGRMTIAFFKAGAITEPMDAVKPSIGMQPVGSTVTQGASNPSLSISASASDGGTLGYQWYSNTSNSNVGGTAINGATSATYDAPTAAVGTTYYYVVVTNTNSSATGSQTATATSNPVAVTINASTPPVLNNGAFTNINFNVDVPTVTNGTYTLDKYLLGAVATTAGSNLAGLVTDDTSSKSFLLEADSTSVGSFKAGINKTDRFGIQTRLQFNNTNSSRSLFEVKSMTPPSGTAAWPTLLVFDQNGKIKDSKGNVLGSYAANQWYDIVIDLDTPGYRYSAWINGVQVINNQDLGNWVGVYQTKITQYANANKTASQTRISILKAGSIVQTVQDLIIPDLTVDLGKAAVLSYQTVPNPAYVENVTWTSSDPNIAKITGNGLLALHTGVATVTATERASGISKTFKVTVQQPTHSWNSQAISSSDLTLVLTSAYRPELSYNFDQIMTAFPDLANYLDMDETSFIQAVQEASAIIPNPDQHTKFEKYARLFTQLYQLTNDPKYQRKAALILYYQALDYPRIVVNHNYTDFWGGNYQFPQDAVYAYGSLINSDIWGQIVPGISADVVKQTIEGFWLSPGAYECLRLMNSMELNNITPYGGRSAVVTGMLLYDPDMIRDVIGMYDQLFTGNFYFHDAMWYEETTAYGNQVANNAQATVLALKDWTDPQGYVDTTLGLRLNQTDLSSRWPLLQQTQGFGTEKMIYPDGKPIPVSDTYGKTGSPQPLPITSSGLKNIEMPGLGYYGLFQGDLNDATHAGLLYQPTDLGFSGGHTHTNFLSLDLWGAGVEMLPYTGYINATSYSDGSGQTLRYPSMRPQWRNMPWVWRQDGANTSSVGAWEKPALLAYDPGTNNAQQVQLVEASDPGANDADMKRRLVMMINLDGNRNYTFDLTRMQGGQAHEIYQRGAELEGMDVQVQGIQLTDTGKRNLQDYLTSINSTAGLSTDRNQLLYPKTGSGDNGFSFTWTGQQTGATLRTFMNGVSGSDVFLSSIPRARVLTTKTDEPNVVTPHLTRRHIVSDSSQITQFGSVYEIFKQGQLGEVTNVDWLKPDDGDPMTNVAVVTSNTYMDMIYTSGDTKERSFRGITFAGSLAMARIDKSTGKLVYTYVYGQGKVVEQNTTLTGFDAQQMEITAATTASTNTGLDPVVRGNTITVSGHVLNKERFIGQWLQTRFGDGSGYGVKVKDLTEVGDSTVITLEQYTPFRLTDTGVQLLFSPNVSILGKAYIVFDLPTFILATNAAKPRIDTQPTGKTVIQGTSSPNLIATATVNDGGTLSFQWYSNTTNSNSDGVAIDGATSPSYAAPTATVGTTYYYVVVTNTNNNATGTTTATVTSNAVAVTVKSGQSTGGQTPDPTPEPTPKPTPEQTPGKPELKGDVVDAVKIKEAVESALDTATVRVFSDVSPTDWSSNAVAMASKIGFISGYPNGTFNSNASVTRAEFATMLVKALGIKAKGSDNFDDAQGSWAANAIAALKTNGIVSGYSDGTFRPNNTISRSEIVTILSKLMNLNPATGASKFNDVSGSWAEQAINQLANAGIVSGKGDGKFNPSANVTRAESVTMILRVLNVSLDLGLNL